MSQLKLFCQQLGQNVCINRITAQFHQARLQYKPGVLQLISAPLDNICGPTRSIAACFRSVPEGALCPAPQKIHGCSICGGLEDPDDVQNKTLFS